MPALTKNFSSSEFNVGGVTFPPSLSANLAQLAALAQWLRDLAGAPGTITSAYRTPDKNAAVGGSENSQHMKGEAIDLVFRTVGLRTMARRALTSIQKGTAPKFGQLIFYNDKGHIHVSLPTLGARNGEVRYSFESKPGERLYPFLTLATVDRVPTLSGSQTRGALWLGVGVVSLAALLVWVFTRPQRGRSRE